MENFTQSSKTRFKPFILILGLVSIFGSDLLAQGIPAGGSLPSVMRLTQNLRRIAYVIRNSAEPIEAFYPAHMALSGHSRSMLSLLEGAFSDETAAWIITQMERSEYLAFVQANENRWITHDSYKERLAIRLSHLNQPTKENLLKAFEKALVEDPDVINEQTAQAIIQQFTEIDPTSDPYTTDLGLYDLGDIIEKEKSDLLDYARCILQAESTEEITELLSDAEPNHSGWAYLLRIFDQGVFGDFEVHMLKTLSVYEGIWEALPEASKGPALRDWLILAKATLTRARVLDPTSFMVPTRSVLSPTPSPNGEKNFDWIDFRRLNALVNFARVHLQEKSIQAELAPYLEALAQAKIGTNSNVVAHFDAISRLPEVPASVFAYREFNELNLALARIEDVYFPEGHD